MRLRSFIFTTWFAMALSVVNAQSIAVRAILDTNRAYIGDQLRLHLIVERQDSAVKVIFPVFKNAITPDIELVGQSLVKRYVKGKGIDVLTQDLLITVFDTGAFEIPELPFIIYRDNGKDTIKTLPVGFQIMPVKADSTLKDIKAIYKMPLSVQEVTQYTLYFIAAALLVFILYFSIKRGRKKTSGETAGIPKEPPYKTALEALHKLDVEKPWQQHKIKYYYSRISEILRVYIEGQFRMQVLEQTTEEILVALKNASFDPAEIARLSSILKLADLVKFAKVIPEGHDNAAQIGSAVDFINNTLVPKERTEEQGFVPKSKDINHS
jgi:hypothetical protein